MKVSRKINNFRRSIMRKLTSNIGKSRKRDFSVDKYNDKTVKILIVRPNRVHDKLHLSCIPSNISNFIPQFTFRY
jgi:hypothetical protein